MKQLEIVETAGGKIVRLYLEKLELLTYKEREILIKSIELLNQPLFVTETEGEGK